MTVSSDISLVHKEMLDEVYRDYDADPAFAHLRSAGLVEASGDSTRATLAVVGEAPGRREAETGMPFVGASGSLLNDLLRTIGVSRADCFVTNVIKYRPDGNRTPTDDEVAAARPYLRRELAVLGVGREPPPTLLVGAIALRLVVPGSTVGGMRGMVIDRGRWRYVPTYHPAAALRNRHLIPRVEEDLRTVKGLLRCGS